MVRPGWQRLWDHSYRLGLRWLARGLRHGWQGWRVGVARLLIPMDPLRYYELGRIADEPLCGLNLDVSSPKLLASLLHHEGRGTWVAIDLFEQEIASWRHIDPGLPLQVCDATRLPYPDGTFDNCICVSVIEHIPGDGDCRALGEMWRVLRPGGTLYLTTGVAPEPGEVFIERPVYGAASKELCEKVFFERHYTPAELETKVCSRSWEIAAVEYVRQINLWVEQSFYAYRPWSYLLGPALRWFCPHNFAIRRATSFLPGDEGDCIFLKLRKT
jgi:SAM-dependent methyltransferase